MEVYKSTQPLKDETTGKYFYPLISVDQIYPIGSIYMSVNNVNSSALFGGTWEQIKDRFLLSAGDTYSAGSTGGEATHTLTVDEMPSHRHTPQNMYWATMSGTSVYDGGGQFWRWSNTAQSSPVKDAYIGATGGDQPHNNMPPYLAVYVWKRTA